MKEIDITLSNDELSNLNPMMEHFAKLLREGYTLVFELADNEKLKAKLKVRCYKVE